MGPRNLLILFFSTVAVSLVILIIFFSLFFKNMDLNFNTRLPESAPDIGSRYTPKAIDLDSKADGLMRSSVHVPPEFRQAEAAAVDSKPEETETPDTDLPPVSDDVMLEGDADDLPPLPMRADPPEAKPERAVSPAPAVPRAAGHRPERPAAELPAQPLPLPDAPSGPPVPGQG